MGLHSGRREVVKSGCHALAILSDIQGQGARIAGADGVKASKDECDAVDGIDEVWGISDLKTGGR